MLDEQEWAVIEPLLLNRISEIKQYRKDYQASLTEAVRQDFGQEALQRYYELTGTTESNPDVLWHHRAWLFGPPCMACGKPLRTPRAAFCAECGALRA